MALVSSGFELNVTLMDSGGNTSTLNYQLVATNPTAAATDAATIMTRLGDVTSAVIKRYTISEVFVEDDLVYPATAQVENRANIVCQIDGDVTKTVTVRIPAPVQGIFVSPTGPASNIIDVTDTTLINYIDIWRLTGALATISDGEYIRDSGSILRGFRSHRQSSYG